MAGQQYSTNLGLAIAPEVDQARVGGDVYTELTRIHIAIQGLQAALDSYTGVLGEDKTVWNQVGEGSFLRAQNMSRIYCYCGDDFTAGQTGWFADFGNGNSYAIRADASVSRPARAYATGNYANGTYGEFILFGLVSIGGLTPGTVYYQSNSPGFISSSPGTLNQKVGWALTTSQLWFNPAL